MASPNPLNAYLGVQVKMDRQLRKILKEAAITAAKYIQSAGSGVGAQVRAAQLGIFLAQLKQDQYQLWVKEIEPLILKYYPIAERAADEAASYLTDVLIRAVGKSDAGRLLEALKTQSRLGIVLDAARRPRVLSGRVYKNYEKQSNAIETIIRSHLITGSVNPRELALAVKHHIDPSTPGGTSYAAMRLARTETNNAFHERQIQNAADRPWIKATKWNLSGSHPHTDICNVIAEGHSAGLSTGEYKADEIPEKPHPHCFCYLTYETLSEKDMTNFARRFLGKGDL